MCQNRICKVENSVQCNFNLNMLHLIDKCGRFSTDFLSKPTPSIIALSCHLEVLVVKLDLFYVASYYTDLSKFDQDFKDC